MAVMTGSGWAGCPGMVPWVPAAIGLPAASLLMNSSMFLWVYIAMLIAGGMVGFIKAGSKASIISSCILAVPLVAVNLGFLPMQVAWAVIGVVGVIFAVRFAKSRKPMPAIPMIVASVVVLTLLIVGRR